MMRAMERVTPCLMFVADRYGDAAAAIDRYVSAFAPDAEVLSLERWGEDEPGESVKRARLRLAGSEVIVMDGPGPHAFTFTPATSLVVECDDVARVDAAWAALAEGGEVLMALQEYPFSPRFGWLNDRFGVSWQIMLA
jgi:predicted 3-demethylubiquinone-9 3-methyltransferase (glyoxalase superfamily)